MKNDKGSSPETGELTGKARDLVREAVTKLRLAELLLWAVDGELRRRTTDIRFDTEAVASSLHERFVGEVSVPVGHKGAER